MWVRFVRKLMGLPPLVPAEPSRLSWEPPYYDDGLIMGLAIMEAEHGSQQNGHGCGTSGFHNPIAYGYVSEASG